MARGVNGVSNPCRISVPSPRKGTRHVLRLIRDILFFQPTHRGTAVKEALDFLNRVQRRRAIVFLLSDFLDQGYEKTFRRNAAAFRQQVLRRRMPVDADV